MPPKRQKTKLADFHKPAASAGGFTLAEVCVAVAVAVLFGAAAFGTNSRLLLAVRRQKETTAAAMMLQQRMESLRASAFSSIADKDYLKANILTAPNGVETAARAPLRALKEQISVGVYQDTATAPIILLSDPQHPIPQVLSDNGKLADPAVNLLQVDLLLQWTSANGRVRTRQLSAVFGRGNIGP